MTASRRAVIGRTLACHAVFFACTSLILAASPVYAATEIYDSFEKAGGYTLSDYQAKWANPFGLGEMAINDTRDFSTGSLTVAAAPFQTASDFGVFDHLKYIGISTKSFAVPTSAKITFSSTIQADTVGTTPGRVINGTYVQSGNPYSAATLVGQQAAAVMNVIDFATGQLFDWFVSGNTAFTLIERLPSAVTNPSLMPGDPGYVGIDKIYTQIIQEFVVRDGPQDVAISYSRAGGVEYLLNGVVVSQIANVGVPLDQQGVPFTGTYPSYGPGEQLAGQINSFNIGHGLFSLLDAFPFQLPDRPDLAVTIPLGNRAFGQGVTGTFDDFTVTSVPEPATWMTMIAGLGIIGGLTRRQRRHSPAMLRS